MKKILLAFSLALLISFSLNAQTGVAISAADNPTADPSAMLDVSSTSKGALVPRMTTAQRDAISSPSVGLLVYNTTTNEFNFYNGTAWVTGTTGQSSSDAYGTSSLTSFSSTTFTVIPGLTQTINVPASSTLRISTNGGFLTNSVSSSGSTTVDVAIFIDGVSPTNGAWQRFTAANTAGVANKIEDFAMTKTADLSAGNHTIDVRVKYISGSTATVGGNNTSVLQGTLSITVTKK